MSMSETYLNAIADHGASLVTHVSLANGPAEGNELPSIVRQAVSWNPATDGNLDSSNIPVFEVAAGSIVSHVQFWDAAEDGNFMGAAPVTSETFAGVGTYTLQDANILHNTA